MTSTSNLADAADVPAATHERVAGVLRRLADQVDGGNVRSLRLLWTARTLDVSCSLVEGEQKFVQLSLELR